MSLSNDTMETATFYIEPAYCDSPVSPLPTIFFGTKMFYGTLSVAVYVLNVLAMRRSKISKTFFVLYSTCAFLSSSFFIEYMIVKQFLTLGHFCDFFWFIWGKPNWSLAVTHWFSAYAPIAILVLHTLIAFHRLTAVISPLKSKLWDKEISKIWAVGMLIPFIFMYFEIPCRGFVIKDKQGGLDIKYEKLPGSILGMCNLSSTLFSVIAAGIFGVCTLLATCCMLYILKTRTVSVSDYGLIYFELMMAFITMLYAATQGLLFYARSITFQDPNDPIKYTVEIVRTYVVDVFILPQSWSLLYFSKIVRRSVLMFLGVAPKREIRATTILCGPDARSVTRTRTM